MAFVCFLIFVIIWSFISNCSLIASNHVGINTTASDVIGGFGLVFVVILGSLVAAIYSESKDIGVAKIPMGAAVPSSDTLPAPEPATDSAAFQSIFD